MRSGTCDVCCDGGALTVDGKDEDGLTPLHRAAWNGHLDMVRMLAVELDANVEAKTKKGESALHYAARGWLDIACMLVVDGGANVDAKDENGDTPLHWAKRFCEPYVLRMLVVEGGANVNITNKDGETPLHYAALHSFTPLLHLEFHPLLACPLLVSNQKPG